MTSTTSSAHTEVDPRRPTPTGNVPLPARWWRAVGAEWTKLASVRSTAVCILAAAVIAAGLSGLFSLAVTAEDTEPVPDARALATVGVALGQFGLLTLAALTITAEYATGTVRPSLSAVPGRGVLLAAKASLLLVVMYVASFVVSAVAVLAAVPLLGEDANFAVLDWLEFSARSGLAVTLLAIFVLGLGALMRSTAGTVTSTLGLVFAPLIISGVINNDVIATIIEYLPNTLADCVAGSSNVHSPVVGGLLLAGWSLLALLGGYVALHRRDA